MGKSKGVIWSVVIGVALAGCVSMGKEVTQDQLAGFKKGQTTPDQVIARLGQPTSKSIAGDGSQSMSYVFAHAQARPASFIPIIGPLVGGTDSRGSNVIFLFGPDGKLINYYASQSQTGMGTGAAGGKYQAPTPDQPREAPPR